MSTHDKCKTIAENPEGGYLICYKSPHPNNPEHYDPSEEKRWTDAEIPPLVKKTKRLRNR